MSVTLPVDQLTSPGVQRKINKNCKTKPSATGGVWLFSRLVQSIQESISIADRSKPSSGTADVEAGSYRRGGCADRMFGCQWLFQGSRIAACYWKLLS